MVVLKMCSKSIVSYLINELTLVGDHIFSLEAHKLPRGIQLIFSSSTAMHANFLSTQIYIAV